MLVMSYKTTNPTERNHIQKMVGASIVKDEEDQTRHVDIRTGKLGTYSHGTFWSEDFENNNYGILNSQWWHFQRWGGRYEVNLDLFFKGKIPEIFQGKFERDISGNALEKI